jgi:hypothetical protein
VLCVATGIKKGVGISSKGSSAVGIFWKIRPPMVLQLCSEVAESEQSATALRHAQTDPHSNNFDDILDTLGECININIYPVWCRQGERGRSVYLGAIFLHLERGRGSGLRFLLRG